MIVFLSHVAMVAGFDMVGNVSLHTRSVVGLEKALFHFVDAIMPYQQISVGFCQNVLNKLCW